MKERSDRTSLACPASTKPGVLWRALKGWRITILFMLVVVCGRLFAFDLRLIPTGSMEPTLVGHPSHGDRILVDKLAYRRGDPQRFDVAVFSFDSEWTDAARSYRKDYVKRVVGLPGETIVLWNGDLYRRDGDTGRDRIIRKWKASESFQESLWQPVSVATFKERVASGGSSDLQKAVIADENHAAFPWLVEPGSDSSVTRTIDNDGNASLRIAGPSDLSYAHTVTNVFVKQGRWPFQCQDCPRASERLDRAELVDSSPTESVICPYLPNSWTGVRCTQCRRLRFPLGREWSASPRIVPDVTWRAASVGSSNSTGVGRPRSPAGTPFFYGDFDTVSDLKIEMAFRSFASRGSIELAVGSDVQSAIWSISLGDQPPPAAGVPGHRIPDSKPECEPGKTHVASLAWVDGTVMAWLDGDPLPPLEVDIQPAPRTPANSVARIRFHGAVDLEVTRLNLYRDLHYTVLPDGSTPAALTSHDRSRRFCMSEHGPYVAEVPQDAYMVLGDNAPASWDSRIWGFVPRKNLLGRACLIWWPPSRWRIIESSRP